MDPLMQSKLTLNKATTKFWMAKWQERWEHRGSCTQSSLIASTHEMEFEHISQISARRLCLWSKRSISGNANEVKRLMPPSRFMANSDNFASEPIPIFCGSPHWYLAPFRSLILADGCTNGGNRVVVIERRVHNASPNFHVANSENGGIRMVDLPQPLAFYIDLRHVVVLQLASCALSVFWNTRLRRRQQSTTAEHLSRRPTDERGRANETKWSDTRCIPTLSLWTNIPSSRTSCA